LILSIQSEKGSERGRERWSERGRERDGEREGEREMERERERERWREGERERKSEDKIPTLLLYIMDLLNFNSSYKIYFLGFTLVFVAIIKILRS
jgi:hypothetical protein